MDDGQGLAAATDDGVSADDGMTPELYARVKAIYLDALDLTPREQQALIERRCEGDAALRAAVQGLLGQTHAAPLIDDAPPADDPLRVTGMVLDGRFTIGECVAEGGFSHVYRGEDGEGRPVALKVLKPGPAGADAVALRVAFEQEAGILDQLRGGAAVVSTYGMLELTTARGDVRPVLAMEWLHGQVLAAALSADRRRWPLAELRAVLDPVAATLGMAHEAGVAHRDVKPDNIFLVTPDAASGEAGRPTSKLFDFGVAKVAALHTLGFESTGRGLSAFTVSYAAPEQVSTRWGSTGPWTDVYALALVCAEMLGGARPLTGPPAAMMAATLDPERRPVPEGLDAPVEAALRAALSVDPKRRPRDASAFWASLAPGAKTRRRWWPFGR